MRTVNLNTRRRSLRLSLLVLGLWGFASSAVAQSLSFHLDVAVRAEDGRLIAQFCGSSQLGCDSLPVLEQLGLDPTQVPIDALTGSPIFVSDLGDFAGGPYSTDDPGFQSLAGWLPADLMLMYEAQDTMRWWDPARKLWTAEVPDDARVRLYGGLPPEAVSTDPAQCGGLPFCLVGTEGSTIFTVRGIEASPTLIIDNTGPAGALHAHLDWFLESPAGIPGGARGAYLMTLRMSAQGLTPSHSFMVMLNNGLTVDEFAEAIQARIAYRVDAVSGTGGSISPTTVEVRHGQTTSLTVTPAAGYSIDQVSGCAGTLSGTVFTTGPVTAACTVSATFRLNQYAVTSSAGSGGSIAPSAVLVNHGGTASFSVTPQPNYSIASIAGCSGNLSGDTYTTGPITAACTVTATFTLTAAPQHPVSARAGTGGRIEPAATTVNEGGTVSFTLTPDEGYAVATASGCGGTLSGSAYTTGAIFSACTVDATFALRRYALTASATAGTIAPTMITVNHGDAAAFTLTPQPGYGVLSIAGCPGTLNGNVYTTTAVSGACTLVVTFAPEKPRFEPAAPAPYDLNAIGLLTELPAEAAPRALDVEGNPLAVTLVGEQTHFPPGTHVLTWRAVDRHGAVAMVEQTLYVHPLVSMGPDIVIGYRQGNWNAFRIVLNGPAPRSPLIVGFSVDGHLQDHDLRSGSVEFAGGELMKEVFLTVTGGPSPGAADQQITVTLDPSVNRSARDQLSVTLRTANSAPVVRVSGVQAGRFLPAFGRDNGSVVLTADILDPDSGDGQTVQWQFPAGAVATSNGAQLTLQPESLPTGIHYVEAVVTDNGVPAQIARGGRYLVLTDVAPTLPDGASAWASNGLPDHPSYSPAAQNILPQRAQGLRQFLIEADPGAQLALGPYAIRQGQHRAELAAFALPLADTLDNVGGYFDFQVEDLPVAESTVNLVIPQRAPIPQDAVYRKYNPINRAWQNFVLTANDALASAPGHEGYCPPPSSTQYHTGLQAGDWCVRLTLNDGGPNDGDGQANGSITDLGGVAATSAVIVRERPPPGGAGAISGIWLALLVCIVLWGRSRRFSRRR